MREMSIRPATDLSRRSLLIGSGGLMMLSLLPQSAMATPEEVQTAIRDLFGDRSVNEGRVSLKLPPISENGNSVSLNVMVDSPMTAEDYVRQVAIFAEANPSPEVARFMMGPQNGIAEVSTRIRLRSTQKIVAVAEMNDGSLWGGSAETVVTLAACVVI